jgi:hypothetical protein
MNSELSVAILRRFALAPIALGVLSAILAGVQVTQAATWTSGEYTYASWTSCENSQEKTEPCTYGVSAFSFENAWSGLVLAVVLLSIGIGVLFSKKFQSFLIRRLRAPFAKLNSSLEQSSKNRKARKEQEKELDELALSKTVSVPKFVKVASRNNSLVALSGGTTLMIVFGLISGLIGVFASQGESESSILFGAAFGYFSQVLLALGFGGKLLISTAKVIVEGLSGNIRDSDEYEQQSDPKN